MNIRVTSKDGVLKIYFGSTLHLALTGVYAIQSWVTNNPKLQWIIEYSTERGDTIVCEYDKVEKWKEILRHLDSAKLF